MARPQIGHPKKCDTAETGTPRPHPTTATGFYSESTTRPYLTTSANYPTPSEERGTRGGLELEERGPRGGLELEERRPRAGLVKRGDVEEEILSRTNEYRALHGSPALTIDTTIQASAAAFCSKLASENAFYHSSSG